MKLRLNLKNRVLYKWIISYVLVFLIPLLLCTFLFQTIDASLKKQIVSSNNLILDSIRSELESFMDFSRKISYQLSMDSLVNMFVDEPEKIEQIDNKTNVSKIINYINNTKMLDSKNTNFASVFIYFRETQIAIGDFGVASKKSLYDMLLKEEFNNSDDMDSFFKQNYIDTFGDINSNSKNNKSRYLCYCKSIPFDSENKEKGATIVVLLSNEFFDNTLENSIFGKELYLTLLSKRGDKLLANFNISDKIIEYCMEQLVDNEQYLNLEYEDMMLSVIKEDLSKVVYLLALPKRVFWKETIVINIYIVLTVLFAMILGALAIYVFSKNNYSPLKKLMTTVSSRTNENFNNLYENEYLYLHNTIEKTLNKNDSLEKSVYFQKRSLDNLTLYKVLNGDVNEYHDLRSIMLSYFENCEQSSTMVLYVTIDSLGVFGESSKNNYCNSMASFAIMNVMEECLNKIGHVITIEIDVLKQAYILLYDDETAIFSRMEEAVLMVQKFLYDEFSMVISVSASESHNGITEIHNAYLEATEVYRIKMPTKGKIIYYNELDNNQMYFNAISGLEEQLQNFIRNNEIQRAFSIIDKVFVKLENVSAVSVDFNYSLLVSNIICLVKDEGFLSEFTQIVGRIEDKNMFEMKQSLYKLIEVVSSQLKDKKNTSLQKGRVDEIIQYVSENYMDVNLNVSQVSYHFGISSRYLSKQFTEHTGVSLLDFINKTRVSQAKIMLVEQNFTEREIAQKVGFTNGAGFIRIFKQCEGITPGQYRKLNK